jgi:hypothetical protein
LDGWVQKKNIYQNILIFIRKIIFKQCHIFLHYIQCKILFSISRIMKSTRKYAINFLNKLIIQRNEFLKNNNEMPIVFHLFSGNGIQFYGHVISCLDDPKVFLFFKNSQFSFLKNDIRCGNLCILNFKKLFTIQDHLKVINFFLFWESNN